MNSKFYFNIRLFKIEIFCNIINVFTVIFDQFNAFFMDRSINFSKNILLTPGF